MRILAIDTALEACSAAVFEAGSADPLAAETLPMARGHAEALMPMLDRVVSATAGGFGALGRVAVTVGPGSFTGLRVGISAARAIALAAGIPAVGVTTLSAFAAPAVSAGQPSPVAAAIDARHGALFLHVMAAGGRTIVAPRFVTARDGARLLGSGPIRIVGSGAAILAVEARTMGVEVQSITTEPAPLIQWVARLGLVADPAHALPKPFYLRAPDARPQDHARIPRR
ncbi:MAG: tRNA (adenosine(37)-N6)-threonylcarbamoyltransferase complex dimerization subunit type 1 TsaB [Alsobacter sp.]